METYAYILILEIFLLISLGFTFKVVNVKWVQRHINRPFPMQHKLMKCKKSLISLAPGANFYYDFNAEKSFGNESLQFFIKQKPDAEYFVRIVNFNL